MTRQKCFVTTCDRQTTAGLCTPHRRDLTNRLDNLRDLVDDLNTQLTRQARYSTTGGSTTDPDGQGTSTPVAWNEGASRTLQRIETTMRRWDQLTQDRLGQPLRHPNPLRAATAIRQAITAGQLDNWPTIARLINDLDEIHTRTLKTIDRPAIEHFLGICTTPIDILIRATCDTRLYGLEDTDTINCPTCGTSHIVDTTLELLLTMSDDTLVTAAQAARALSTKDDTDHHRNRLVDRIRQWQTRGRILARGTITDGGRQRQLYRLGDVKALVNDHDRTTHR